MVLTSGNVSDEPIAYGDDDALARLAGIADAFLTHDRAIHIRTDDSVVRPFRGRETVLRRSRGYAPRTARPARPVPRPVLACGAELKNTFCLGRSTRVRLPAHRGPGELRDAALVHRGHRPFPAAVRHRPRRWSRTTCTRSTCPPSTRWNWTAPSWSACSTITRTSRPAWPTTADGPGHRGGLRRDRVRHRRHHLGRRVPARRTWPVRAGGAPGRVPMPGGAAAIRQPWRMAAVYLDAAYPGALPDGLAVAGATRGLGRVLAMARRGINSPLTSSAGRLFDAVAALLGVRDTINYEGQAAIELEQLPPGRAAAATLPGSPGCPRSLRPALTWSGRPPRTCWPGCRRSHRRPVPPRGGRRDRGRLRGAARADRARHGGAVRRRVPEPAAAREGGPAGISGFRVLTHARVPPNDGGISLGQAVVAAARSGPAPSPNPCSAQPPDRGALDLGVFQGSGDRDLVRRTRDDPGAGRPGPGHRPAPRRPPRAPGPARAAAARQAPARRTRHPPVPGPAGRRAAQQVTQRRFDLDPVRPTR